MPWVSNVRALLVLTACLANSVVAAAGDFTGGKPSSVWRTESGTVVPPTVSTVQQKPRVTAGFEEILLEVLVPGRAPRTLLLIEGADGKLYLPAVHAEAAGIPIAQTEVIQGLREPVVAGITLTRENADQVHLAAPASYFGHTELRFGVESDVTPLKPLPAYWFDYNLFAQPLEGYRPFGGSVRAAASLGAVTLKSEFRSNQSYSLSPVSRVSTSLLGNASGLLVEAGDLTQAAQIPVTTSRNMLGLRLSSGGVHGAQMRTALHGATDIPGRVTVAANGQPVASYTVMPGTFDVADLPRIGGAGLYELMFDDGKSVKLLGAVSTFNPISLISPGQYSYSVAAGVAQSRYSVQQGSPAYTHTPAFDAQGTYGVSLRHNVSMAMSSGENETWAGGALLSEWTAAISTHAGLYAVRAAKGSGAVSQLDARYQRKDFSFGAGWTQFLGGPQGTPSDGFLSERKLSAGWRYFNIYLLSSRAATPQGQRQFTTAGLGYTQTFGQLALSTNVSRTQREEGHGLAFGVFASWTFGQSTSLYSSVSDTKSAIGARGRGADWQVSAEMQRSRATSSATSELVSGQLGYRYGLLYGSAVNTSADGKTQGTVGVAGAFAAVQTPKGFVTSGYSQTQGDGLLVLDTGSPRAEVLVNHTRRVVADDRGLAAVSAFTNYPQTLQLDVRTLDIALTAERAKQRIQLSPQSAGYATFNVRPLGLGLSLVDERGAPIEEGSIVRADTGYETLVGSEGLVWLEEPAKVLTVQVGPKEFCRVAKVSEGGRHVCSRR